MKRSLIMLVAVLLLIGGTASAQINNLGSFGAGVNGGLIFPAGGDVDVADGFADVFKVGPSFGVHFNYTPIKELTLRTGLDYAFMKMEDDYALSVGPDPYLTTPYVYLDGMFNLGNFIKNETNIFNPYLLAGGGLYFWKITDDGAGGDAITDGGEEFSKTSFGLNFGGGLEVFATPNLSIYGEGKYHMVFTEDEEKFGEDFGNLGAVDVTLGLTYYFPMK